MPVRRREASRLPEPPVGSPAQNDVARDRQICAPTKRSPERTDEMNILGLRSEQLGMNRFGQATSLAEIEANC